MKESYLKPLKSTEIEDWVDVHIIRRCGYHLARLAAVLGLHPNLISFMSILCGLSSCIFIASHSYRYAGQAGVISNMTALLLLVLAEILDCCDGQLARMTGKSTRFGRILDGSAGFFYYVPLYHLLTYRFYTCHSLEFNFLGIAETPSNVIMATSVVFVLMCLSGYICSTWQMRMADYFIQIHLTFQFGDNKELEDSRQLDALKRQAAENGERWWSRCLGIYSSYTRSQERWTPQFQLLRAAITEKYGSVGNLPPSIRNGFHDTSLRYMKLNELFCFNPRTALLAVFCLLDIPSMYFVTETIILSILCYVHIARYEKLSRKTMEQLSAI